MAKFKHEKLGESEWYHVIGKTDKRKYAIFSLFDVPRSPAYCKHMDLHILPHITEEIMEHGNFTVLLDIYYFVFSAVLEIAHETKGVELCKIYSDDTSLKMVYSKFANKLGDDYAIKSYGNWIEIHKNPKT